ncbi:uncharacterized protein [Dysidea avara]|uniref:uncharacterized protein n=1 Tax=Dysidea avara TaxID=196820 RepID=UPI00332774F3
MSSASAGSTDPPDLKDLNIYVLKIGKKWYDLGVQLLDKDGPDKLDAIKDNNPKDVETCCTEMFRHWTKNKTDASWKTLIAALKTIGFAVLADEIKRKHCK